MASRRQIERAWVLWIASLIAWLVIVRVLLGL